MWDWLILALAAAVLYFLASGLSFAAMHRWPLGFPRDLAARIFAPLEWLARRNLIFANLYSGFCYWCWYQFGKRDED